MSNVDANLRGIRSALDLLATLLVIAAAAALLTLAVSSHPDQPTAQRNDVAETNSESSSMVPPKAPQAISDSPVLGQRDAKLAVIQYVDFQCPFCAQFSKETLPLIKAGYVDSGKVMVVFKHLPLDSHPNAQGAALGAECAFQQGRFADMHDLLFARSDLLSSSTSLEVAGQLGLNLSVFRQCLKESATALRIDKDVGNAKALGITGTPTFLIGKVIDGGLVQIERVLVGAASFETFGTIFDEFAKNAE